MAPGGDGGYSVSDARLRELGEGAQGHAAVLARAADEFHRVVVGQDGALRKMLVALAAGGHVLLESVPGLAKTLMVSTMAQILDVSHVRIQFTPDLLPADIVGTKIYRGTSGSFVTQKGPIFHNFVLADEINRAPPKVQSALLEAMQEGSVSIHGDTHTLQRPFLVIATQNPVESGGTYPLPEAQTDRFALKIVLGYPSRDEELEIMRRNSSGAGPAARAVLGPADVLAVQEFAGKIYADETVCGYAADIVGATRDPASYGLDLAGTIGLGASPRASIWLVRAAKANALLEGRGFVIPEDVKAVAPEVLRHRIMLTFEAGAGGASADGAVDAVLGKIRPP